MPAAQPAEIDYDLLAEKVAEKVSANNTVMMGAAIDEDEAQEENTEVYIDSDGVRQIADGVAENLDIDTLAQKISEKLQVTVTVDYDKIGAVVEDKLSAVQPVAVCETVEAAQEEVVGEPIVEEVQEEATEELAIAETPQEETVEETPVVPVLVEADADMVIRLKKSFTAKLSQSEENVKVYYSAIKNGLTEYKKINSNISWHGDRFNYGRDTIAKINICGKTLGLYLALDPNDPEFKTTVYHQKDVGKQKAYESTPFMVKIRSEAGMKKALRLVTALAEKLGAQKQNGFVPTDYVAMFPNASDEQLLADGLIKATKEKKVALDF